MTHEARLKKFVVVLFLGLKRLKIIKLTVHLDIIFFQQYSVC